MDRRLEKIIKYFRENAIATSVATGAVAGLPPDSPPVHKKKKKKVSKDRISRQSQKILLSLKKKIN